MGPWGVGSPDELSGHDPPPPPGTPIRALMWLVAEGCLEAGLALGMVGGADAAKWHLASGPRNSGHRLSPFPPADP